MDPSFFSCTSSEDSNDSVTGSSKPNVEFCLICRREIPVVRFAAHVRYCKPSEEFLQQLNYYYSQQTEEFMDMVGFHYLAPFLYPSVMLTESKPTTKKRRAPASAEKGAKRLKRVNSTKNTPVKVVEENREADSSKLDKSADGSSSEDDDPTFGLLDLIAKSKNDNPVPENSNNVSFDDLTHQFDVSSEGMVDPCPCADDDGQTVWKCGFGGCDKKFKSEYTCRRHMLRVHGCSHYVSCPQEGCDLRVVKSELPNHLVQVHNKNLVKCQYCNKQLARGSLKKHEKRCVQNVSAQNVSAQKAEDPVPEIDSPIFPFVSKLGNVEIITVED